MIFSLFYLILNFVLSYNNLSDIEAHLEVCRTL